MGCQSEIVIASDSGWLFHSQPDLLPRVKSYISLAFVVLVFLSVVVAAGLLWYLSTTSEFTRTPPHPASEPTTPPHISPAPTPKLPETPQ